MSEVGKRGVPTIPWTRTAVLMVGIFLVSMTGWEMFWRSQGAEPSFRNSYGLWTMTRRRVEDEGADAVALVGSSRTLFDVNLEVWAEETGRPVPIQLALEGTNPRPFLTDLASDPAFSGLLVVGVTSFLFYPPDVGYRAAVIQYEADESPSQKLGQRISMHLEKMFAFYSFDFAAFPVLRRQPWWPERENKQWSVPWVRKLANFTAHRHGQLWDKVDNDEAYRTIVTDTWAELLNNPPPQPPEEEARRYFQQVLDEVKRDVDAIRARGGEVVFLRLPSVDFFREVERQAFPREVFWDTPLEYVDAVGVHFEDHPELQNVSVPEWSHVSMSDTPQFTRDLVRILRERLAARGITRPELGPERGS